MYDWDDTLVYTREAQFLAYSEAIRHYLNKSLSWELFNKKFYGNSNVFLASIGCDDDLIIKIRELKSRLYIEEYVDKVKLLINEFPKNQKHIIVSNTNKSTIQKILKKFQLESVFSFIVAADAYVGANRKPAPDLFHYAFSKLDAFHPTEDQLSIYEDSYIGATSALNFFQQINILNVKLVYVPPYQIRTGMTSSANQKYFDI